MEENKIDQLFREKLGAPTIPADPAAWQDAEKLLRTTGRGGWWKWIGLSVFVLVACGIAAKVILSDDKAPLAQNQMTQTTSGSSQNGSQATSDSEGNASISESEQTPTSSESANNSSGNSESKYEVTTTNGVGQNGAVSNDHSAQRNTQTSGIEKTTNSPDNQAEKASTSEKRGDKLKGTNYKTKSSSPSKDSAKAGNESKDTVKSNDDSAGVSSSASSSNGTDNKATRKPNSTKSKTAKQNAETIKTNGLSTSSKGSGQNQRVNAPSKGITKDARSSEAMANNGGAQSGSGQTSTVGSGLSSPAKQPANQELAQYQPTLSVSRMKSIGEHSIFPQNEPSLGNPVNHSIFELPAKSNAFSSHNEINISGGYGTTKGTLSTSNDLYTAYIAKRNAEESMSYYTEVNVNYSRWMGRWMLSAGVGSRMQKEDIQYQGTSTTYAVSTDSTITGYTVVWVQNPGTIDSIAMQVPVYTVTTDSASLTTPLYTLMAHNGLHKTQLYNIPIRFGYNFVNSPNWAIVPTIGLDIQYVKSSNVYYSNYDMQTVTSRNNADGYVRLGYSAYGSLELRRKWNKFCVLGAADMRYSLNSWNTNYTHKWMSYGFRLGVGYDF